MNRRLALCSILCAATFASWAHAAAVGGDTDLDGTPDAADAFPCDWRRAAVTFVPGELDFATLMFEDNWPARGDLDFNDAVVLHNYAVFHDATGAVSGIRVTLQPRAIGASIASGVALRLPIPASAVRSIERTVGGGAPSQLNVLAAETDLVVPLVTSLRDLFETTPGFINTERGAASQGDGQRVVVDLSFQPSVSLSLASDPFDLYFFRSDDPRHQIHRPQFSGTATMRDELFGAQDDASSGARYFVDRDGLPFVLSIPLQSVWPVERERVEGLWPDLLPFAASGGTEAADFYASNVNTQKAYPQPSPASLPGVDYAACFAATCSDGARNGRETDVDCGGDCGACGDGGACRVHDDCTSAVCQGGTCTRTDERSCTLAHGSGLEARQGAGWGPCVATACDANYHVDAGACVPDALACAVEHGQGTQTWSGTAWGACTVDRCDGGYHLEAGACAADTRGCLVTHGTGSQTWTAGAWGACVAQGCSAGYHLEGGACAADDRACAINNGTGTQSWTGVGYSPCALVSCNSGYRASLGACVLVTYAWSSGAWGTCGGGTASPVYGPWGACSGGGGTWSYGAWGSCSASAVCSGSGTQSRSASCSFTSGSGSQSRSGNCAFDASSGTQTRAVTCANNFGETVANAACGANPPASAQSCTPAGTPASCGTVVTTQSCTPSDAAVCGTQEPTSQSCASPAGSQNCTISNGTGTQSCAEGATAWGACTPLTCSSGFIAEGGACVSNTGNTQATAGQSCNTIRQARPNSVDGPYWIDPNGGSTSDAFQAYCDMTTDGGGWTLFTNVFGGAVTGTFQANLTTSFMASTTTAQLIYNVSAAIRFTCRRSNSNLMVDVATTNNTWRTRGYATGDGCTLGYNWQPGTSALRALATNNYTYRGAFTQSCCCRAGYRLAWHQIGFNTDDWFIDDPYYSGIGGTCAGGGGQWHRIWYR